MSVYNKEEYLNVIKELVGDKNDDAILAVIQNLTETFDSMALSNEEWQMKYDALDNEWRNRYKDTFFTGTKDKEFTKAVETKKEEELEESGQALTIEDLFIDK